MNINEVLTSIIGATIGFGIASIMAMNGVWAPGAVETVGHAHQEAVYTVETINVTEYIDFRDGQQVECVIITAGDFAMAGPCVTSY
jgi:hypothetical protein